MKTNFIFLTVLLAFALSANAQVIDDIYGPDESVKLEVITPAKPSKETKEEIKAREKKLQEYKDSVAFNRAARALQNAHWVLLADRITLDRTAYTVYSLNNNSNFLFQQDTAGMLQVAYNKVDPGPNGMGGITLEGRISGTRMEIDKKGDIQYSYHISSTEINAHVFITVFKGTDRACANVDSTFGPGSVTIYGRLVPYDHRRH